MRDGIMYKSVAVRVFTPECTQDVPFRTSLLSARSLPEKVRRDREVRNLRDQR